MSKKRKVDLIWFAIFVAYPIIFFLTPKPIFYGVLVITASVFFAKLICHLTSIPKSDDKYSAGSNDGKTI
jgi:dolichyl-phosphate-mannose--protein O-mannosyl transferase